MPSAFIPREATLQDQREEMVPNPEFGEACFKLRQLIMKKATAHVASAADLQDWSRRFYALKTTVEHFGHLGSFRDIPELVLRPSLDRMAPELLGSYVQSESNKDSLERQLQEMQQQLESELTSCLKRRHVRSRADLIDETQCNHDAKADTIEEVYAEKLLLAFDQGCEQIGVSRGLAEDAKRQLRGRVNLATVHRRNTFRSRMSVFRSESCVEEAEQQLKEELGKRRASQRGAIHERDARQAFQHIWEPVREELRRTLESHGTDYRQAIHDRLGALLKVRGAEALSIAHVLSEDPAQDCQLNAELKENKWQVPHQLRSTVYRSHVERWQSLGFTLHSETHIIGVPQKKLMQACALNDLVIGGEIRRTSNPCEVMLVRHSSLSDSFDSLITIQHDSGSWPQRVSRSPR